MHIACLVYCNDLHKTNTMHFNSTQYYTCTNVYIQEYAHTYMLSTIILTLPRCVHVIASNIYTSLKMKLIYKEKIQNSRMKKQDKKDDKKGTHMYEWGDVCTFLRMCPDPSSASSSRSHTVARLCTDVARSVEHKCQVLGFFLQAQLT